VLCLLKRRNLGEKVRRGGKKIQSIRKETKTNSNKFVMSRKFDHGKDAYKKAHKVSKEQQTKHYLGDNLMGHYGVNPEKYRNHSYSNYRMGSVSSNGRDTKIDNALIREHFSDQGKGGYDAKKLVRKGITMNQQLQAVGHRFDQAKIGYELTGHYKYFIMQKDFRDTAGKHLNGDLRSFKLSNR
jgi:hypothetical protein